MLMTKPKTKKVLIVGDSDLVIREYRNCIYDTIHVDRFPVKHETDKWEDIITSIQWLNGEPRIFSEKVFNEMLKNNPPCIRTYMLERALRDAMIDSYKPKFGVLIHIRNGTSETNDLIPIKFQKYYLDEEKLCGTNGLLRLNRFSGWNAEFDICYFDNVFPINVIISIINLAGFEVGIGLKKSIGYGRFHVESVR